MEDSNKVKQINNYITNIVTNMRNNGLSVNKRALNKFRSRYITSNKDLESIYKDIDEHIESYLNDYNEKIVYYDKLKALKTTNHSTNIPFLGESYKSFIIDLFKILEKINSEYNLTLEKKEIMFNTEITRYLFKNKPIMEKFIKKQCSDEKKAQYYFKEMFLGSETLDYNTISNIYNTFTNSIDLVCPESEGKMIYTVKNDKKIFNEDGSINSNLYDFSAMENIYKFALNHKKLLKLNVIVWHGAVPENLEREINCLENHKRRDYLLRFIDNYCLELSNWALNNDFDFRQIEAINELASNEETSMLRNSFWSENIGVNPVNGDNYYIDILKIVRKYFNFSEIIISDFNEFDTSKCDRICGIVKDILEKSKRDDTKYLDALGLQSHYTTWFVKNNQRNELTNSMIFQTMYEYKKLNIPLYRTEMDFKRFRYDTDNYNNLISSRFKADKESNINGYVIWGNSSKLTWYFCEGLNSHPIDSKGRESKEFRLLREEIDLLLHKYKASNKWNEKDYINDIILYAFRDIGNLNVQNKSNEDKVNDIYNFYYDTFDKLINNKIRKKNAIAIDKIKVYLKNCLTIGCTTKEEFKNGMILFNENSDNVDIDKVVDEFKLTLVGNVYEKKESGMFDKVVIAYTVLYVICSIICIILGIRLL